MSHDMKIALISASMGAGLVGGVILVNDGSWMVGIYIAIVNLLGYYAWLHLPTYKLRENK